MLWKPIEDLQEDWKSLVSTEIESLAQAWEETYQTLQGKPELDDFNERLRREWSIETGIIERLYTIDRGTTQLLIEQGIDSSFITHGATNKPIGEVVQTIRAQREALDGLFAFVKQHQSLSVHYIRTLHQVLLRHQDYTEARDMFGNVGPVPLLKGEWKRQPNNPLRPDGTTFEYCPPEQVQSEMDRLIEWHNAHLDMQVSPQIESAWLHHRFTQIHPFQDGNGRVARCLATMVLIRDHRFPLVVTRDDTLEYITALEEADSGDLSRLVLLFDQIEKRAYTKAFELSEDVLRTRVPVLSIADSIAERYQERRQNLYDRVFDVAKSLQGVAQYTLEEAASQMRHRFRDAALPIFIRVESNLSGNTTWYNYQIVETAKDLEYYANLTRPRLWSRIKIIDEGGIAPNAEIVVSLHYLGKENRGAMIATAFLDIIHQSTGEPDDDNADSRSFRETHTIVTDGFTFAYTDAKLTEQRQMEFREWLEQAVAVGLAEWQKQL